MTLRNQRRFAVRAAIAVALVAGATLAGTGGGVASAAATNAGLVTFTGSSSGTSATTFTLSAGAGAACDGNTVHDGTRWHTFITPLATDLSTLTFNSSGPTNTGAFPLYSSTGTPIVNQNTGTPDPLTPAGAGILTPLPVFSLAPLTSAQIPAGTYKLGYACTTNSGATLGKYWFTYLLVDGSTGYTVPTKPLAGAAPDADSYTGGSVSISWSAPDNGGLAIDGYQVEYSSDGGTSWSTPAVISDPAVTNYTVHGLTAATSYRFRVAATNALGVGAWSTQLIKSTATAVSAPSTIGGLTVTRQANGTSLALAWTPPADNGGAAISSYYVWYGTASGIWRLAAPAGAISSYTITGLAKNTAYTVYLVASNGTLTSPLANGSATTASTVAGAPAKPVLTAGVKKITVKWAAPADNGGRTITAYRIQRSTNGTTWTTLTSAGSAATRTYVATGLTTGTKYYFRVAAINSVGVGAFSAANSVKAG